MDAGDLACRKRVTGSEERNGKRKREKTGGEMLHQVVSICWFGLGVNWSRWRPELEVEWRRCMGGSGSGSLWLEANKTYHVDQP